MPNTTADPNKIEYGLSSIYFAPLTKNTAADGAVTYTYGNPVALVGAQAMTREPQGESSSFYADDSVYFTTTTNNGYTGELTFIKMTDQIRQVIFKEEVDETTGLMTERADVLPAEGALLFQCRGDAKNTRHVMYDVTFGRGSEENNTKEDTISPTTATITYTAIPIEHNGKQITKGKATEGAICYDNFFKSVVLPGAATE